MDKEKNCYNCEYRGTIPGDAHSCCKHPDLKEVINDPLAGLMAMFASVGRIQPIDVRALYKNFNIKLNPHGVKMGWAQWPFNYDPVWLENCDGFKEKK